MPEEISRFDRSYDLVGKWLKKQKASLRGDSGSIYNADFNLHGFSARAFVVPLQTGVVMVFDSGLVVEPGRKAELAVIVNELNDRVPFGNFEISVGGGLAFKISTFIGDTEATSFSYLTRCVGAASAMMVNYVPSISTWIKGDIQAHEVISHARNEEKRRANAL